jgi:general secretion pathway protein I
MTAPRPHPARRDAPQRNAAFTPFHLTPPGAVPAAFPVQLGASRTRARAGRKGGFSLIEVMVAVLILGVALAGLTHGLTTALASNKEAELQTAAALMAQGKIEQLRAEGFIEDGEDEGDCGAELALYRWRQTIAATDLAGLHEVTVVIENSNTGQDLFELKTLLFEPPDDSASNASNRKEARARKQRGEGL